jgi:hypothetical protein
LILLTCAHTNAKPAGWGKSSEALIAPRNRGFVRLLGPTLGEAADPFRDVEWPPRGPPFAAWLDQDLA